jgi:hypothetical protein
MPFLVPLTLGLLYFGYHRSGIRCYATDWLQIKYYLEFVSDDWFSRFDLLFCLFDVVKTAVALATLHTLAIIH